MSERIGLSKKDAQEAFRSLNKEMDDMENEMDKMEADLRAGKPIQTANLRRRMDRVRTSFSATLQHYTVYVLEALENETRTLKWLTLVLIGLTVILAVFTGLLVLGVKLP